MSTFSFDLNGKVFSLKAPPGINEEQARAIFKQQADTGSLVGVKVGDALSAATQAAGGLTTAASQLSQQAAGAVGSLSTATNLNSITASIGTAGQAAANQVAASQQGVASAFNSLTTGASSGVATVSRALSASGTSLTPSSVLNQPLTGAAAAAGSLANGAVSALSTAIKATPTNAVNLADIAKQGPALGKIGNLSQADVQGTLAQASKLIGQNASTVSNALGVGKFGLDAGQLEKAGLVKPGTAAAFLSKGQNDLVSVLKSPTVWTGKDGVKGLDNLVSNPGLQNKVQQDLMGKGLTQLKSVGLPTDKLNPQALAGLATNAAKSVPDTVAWAKNSPALPAGVKTALGSVAAAGAFAVALVKKKVDAPVLQETKPEPATNTANTETLTAAAERVVGDARVPDVAPNSTVGDFRAKMRAFLDLLKGLIASFKGIEATVNDYKDRPNITLAEWNTVNNELVAVKALYNQRGDELYGAVVAAVKKLPEGEEKSAYIRDVNKARVAAESLVLTAKELTKKVQDLANKIVNQFGE